MPLSCSAAHMWMPAVDRRRSVSISFPAYSLASRLFRCASLSWQNCVKLSARNDIDPGAIGLSDADIVTLERRSEGTGSQVAPRIRSLGRLARSRQ